MRRLPNDITGASSILFEMCRARLAKTRASQGFKAESLVEFVHEVQPQYDPPYHLRAYCERIQDAPGKSVEMAFHAPPQNGKTIATKCAFLWWDLKYPGGRHVYVTYNQSRAIDVAKEFRALAADAGFEPRGTLAEVTLKGGSTIRFTSIDAGLTGYPIDGVCVIDDPLKNDTEAMSPTRRRRLVSWWHTVAMTRRHPGTSFIVMATRWHREDLTGYLLKHEHWDYVCLKAVIETEDDARNDPNGRQPGEILWAGPSRNPEKRTIEFYDRARRRDPYSFSAMYQGEPVPPGNRMFHFPGDVDADGNAVGPQYYSELPTSGYRIAFGVDLAGSTNPSADWSVLVEGWGHNGRVYIVDVIRAKVEVNRFAEIIARKHKERPGVPFRWYASTTEKNMASILWGPRFRIKGFNALLAQGRKDVRAKPFSIAWNLGEVLLPDPALVDGVDWLNPFLDVMCSFTGINDSIHDDDVDAAAAMYDQLCRFKDWQNYDRT